MTQTLNYKLLIFARPSENFTWGFICRNNAKYATNFPLCNAPLLTNKKINLLIVKPRFIAARSSSHHWSHPGPLGQMVKFIMKFVGPTAMTRRRNLLKLVLNWDGWADAVDSHDRQQNGGKAAQARLFHSCAKNTWLRTLHSKKSQSDHRILISDVSKNANAFRLRIRVFLS